MKNIYLIITLMITAVLFASPASVDKNSSQKVAENIFKQFSESKNLADFNVDRVDIIKSDSGQNLLYVYNLNPTGFIIVAGSNRSLPCLAYSFESDFSLEPIAVQKLIGSYKEEINEQLNNIQPVRQDIQENWDKYLSANPSYPELRDVQPLLNCTFAQSGNWNNGVTDAIGFNGPVGCVAVAQSQVMHYWGYPSSGEGSNTYIEDDFGEISVNFAIASYDFDNMPGGQANSESQQLLFHTGVSVNMDYDQAGSGAWVIDGYPSTEYALENYFKYSSNLYSMTKNPNNPDNFGNAIRNNLDVGMPLILRGYEGDYGGHAWNIDGYQDDPNDPNDDFNSFHCNFGWGGSSNGWYSLASQGGFTDGQAAIFDIYPRDLSNPEALYEYTVDASTVYFTDLSTMINEWDLKNFHWDFGDGNTLTTQSGDVNHSFEVSGTYDVSLIVENMHGMFSDPYVEAITVQAAMVGDLTQDGNIDVLDIVSMVSLILSDQPIGSQLFIGDINGDGVINIQDVILLIGIALNGE